MPRLTKPFACRKTLLATLVLSAAFAVAADTLPPSTGKQLRDCIAKARDAGSITGCELQEQVALKARIERLSGSIRGRLDTSQQQVFERSTTAWQAFFEHEAAMLELSLELRKDGLGPKLLPGAVTRLYEQRELQLREHLHNISVVPPGGKN